jgi:MEMO1 family protein
MADIRNPCVADQFYKGNPDQLKVQVQDLFESGPGLPKTKKWSQTITGGIVPHAGYKYSGKIATYFYKELAETYLTNKRFELMSNSDRIRELNTVILIGPEHAGQKPNASVYSKGNWLTPLGRVEIDTELAKTLIDGAFFKEDSLAHRDEHCLEVQLPFLQFLFKEEMPQILPIVFSIPFEIEICRKYGQKLAEVIKNSKKEIILLASSDLTHYGLNYNYIPFHGTDVENRMNINKLDKGAIKYIENLDAPGFIRYVKETKATICGKVAIAVQLFALKELGTNRGELLKYTASGDITKDWRNSVSYASIKFE